MTDFPEGHPLAGQPLRPGMLIVDGIPAVLSKYQLDVYSIERVTKSFLDFVNECTCTDHEWHEQLLMEAEWVIHPATELQWMYRANGKEAALFVAYSHTWIMLQDGIERLYTAFVLFDKFCKNCEWDEAGDGDVEHLLNDTALFIESYLQFLTEIREAVKAARVVGSWQS